MTKKVSKLKLKRNMKNKKTHVGGVHGNNNGNNKGNNVKKRPVPAPRPPSVKRPVPAPRPESTFAKPRNNNPPPTGLAAIKAQLAASAAAASESKKPNNNDLEIIRQMRQGAVDEAKSLARIAQMQTNNEKIAAQEVSAAAMARRFAEGMPQVSRRRFTNAPPVSAQNLASQVAARRKELGAFRNERGEEAFNHVESGKK